MIPDAAYTPHFGTPVSYIIHRLSSICAILACCMLGIMRPRKWHFAGFASYCHYLFFDVSLYKSHVDMVRMEAQAEQLVSTLPLGCARVTSNT